MANIICLSYLYIILLTPVLSVVLLACRGRCSGGGGGGTREPPGVEGGGGDDRGGSLLPQVVLVGGPWGGGRRPHTTVLSTNFKHLELQPHPLTLCWQHKNQFRCLKVYHLVRLTSECMIQGLTTAVTVSGK